MNRAAVISVFVAVLSCSGCSSQQRMDTLTRLDRALKRGPTTEWHVTPDHFVIYGTLLNPSGRPYSDEVIDLIVTWKDERGPTVRRVKQTQTDPRGRFAIELFWAFVHSGSQGGPPSKPTYPPKAFGNELLGVEVIGPIHDLWNGDREIAFVDTTRPPVIPIDLGYGVMVVDLGDVRVEWSLELPSTKNTVDQSSDGTDAGTR